MSRDAPNLLFLFSDQHAQRVAGCYGDAVVRTPNIDRLAAHGVCFDNAYTPSPICVPARMAMLTGMYPSDQDVWTNDDVLSASRPTWPMALGAAGIETVLSGRMHALGPDQLHGYGARLIGDHSPCWPGVPRHDLGALAKANDPFPESVLRSGPGQSAYELYDEEVTRRACEWLRSRRSGERFALTVGWILPHAPFVARPDDYARHRGRVPPPRKGPPANEHPWLAWWRADRGLGDLPEDAVMRARTAYWALVERVDRMIGEVLAALEASGQAENTLVVYASDHGEQVGERGLWWKHTFYDDSAKVPLVMSMPGVLPEGERRAQVVGLTDLAATMVEATGATALPNARARSFWPVARDAASPWLDLAFSEYCTDAVPEWTGGDAVRQRMVRLGDHKLIHYHGHRPQLFDLAADPGEDDDLGASPDHAALRERLSALVLEGWDADDIGRRMAKNRADKDLIGAWARVTRPADPYLWPMRPDMNRLDG